MNNDFSDLPQIDFSKQPIELLDPMHLDLDDDEIVRVVKENIRSSVGFYTEKNLYQKQQKNLEYYYGRQALYQASNKSKPYKENVIYESLTRQKPIALSRMPDLTVKPGDDSMEAKKTAQDLTGIFNSDIKKRSNRKLLGLAFKQEPIYYYAPVKAIWNPEKGPYGDYEFVNVHPDNIVWDHNCSTNDVNNMRFVSERAKFTLGELIIMFPDKEEEIKEEFGWTKDERDDDAKMASPVKIWETWFHWYKKAKADDEKKETEKKGPKRQTERIDGVVWIYGDLVLKKMKNPYFDYQGRKKIFSKEFREKNATSVEDIFLAVTDDGQSETVYNNYFQDPEKPYFFMVYENMGEQPISETSRVEQILEFQDSINMNGSIIQDMNIRSRGKDLFDTNAITQDALDEINIYDIDQVVGLDVPQGSSINNAHARIEQMPATQQQYKSMNDDRSKAFEMLGTGPATRGLSNANATLGQEQMSREGDYGLVDDIVEDTINACAEWQANWSMQFIKLFYTKVHMRHILGKDGEVLHTRLSQDSVDNGMEVVVSASGVDKMLRKRMAEENMKLGIGDPLSYYEDTEQSSPRERALRAMMAQGSPQMYIAQYLAPKPEGVPGQPPSAADQALAASPGGDPNAQPPAAPAGPPMPPAAPPMGGGNAMDTWRWYPNRQQPPMVQ
jgi:hypothetical protein